MSDQDDEEILAQEQDLEEEEENEDPTKANTRNILGAFILMTVLGLMIVIWPYGITLNGNVLGAQVLIFSFGVIVFFLEIGCLTVA